MNNRRKKVNGAYLIVSLLVFLLAANVTLSAVNGPPEICGASIVSEGATLIYGGNFDDEAVTAHVQKPPEPKKDEKPWGENELKASLERVLAGKPEYPAEPADKAGGWQKVEHKEGGVLLCNTGGDASSYPSVVKVLRVKNSKGISKAYRLNVPEIWGVSPRKVVPGESLAVWGVNIGGKFGLVSQDGKVAAICEGYRPFCDHSHRPEIKFIRHLIVPETVSPGTYFLHNWGGFEDAGWSEPVSIQVISRPEAPKVTINVKESGAKGDGVTDDTESIIKAINTAGKSGGTVMFPAGRYVISKSLEIPEGVKLEGNSPESTIIQASKWKTFAVPEGGLPERVFSRPPDYDAKTYKTIGWGIDWLMSGMYKTQACMVWLKSNTGIENITLDASNSLKINPIILISDDKGQVCYNPVVLNCRILYERAGLFGSWPDFHFADGITLFSSTEDMVIEQNKISVPNHCINQLPGYTRGARIRYNTFTTPDPHSGYSLWMRRTTQACLIEANIFENGGRATTEQTAGYPYPVARNCWIHNIFKNFQKGDGELLMHETGSISWFGQVKSADAKSICGINTDWKPTRAGALTGAQDAGYAGYTAVIMGGKGLGQFRAIISNTADTLAVDKPWQVVPDQTTTFGIMSGGVVESVFIGNEFFNCSHYSGIYGSGIRNVWVNEVHESVSGGTYLWPIADPQVMALNLIYGNKYHERAGVMILNDRRSAKEEAGAKPGGVDNEWAQAYKKLPKCFGNEVRGCSIRARSYVSTENGQIWGDVIRHTWAEKGRTCPITPVPGTEAAISISESLQWASYPDEPKLDDYPPSTRWNLLAENMITRCPVGVLIGKAVDKTILDGNSFYECGEPVKDLGRNTVNLDSFVHNASKEKTALAPQK